MMSEGNENAVTKLRSNPKGGKPFLRISAERFSVIAIYVKQIGFDTLALYLPDRVKKNSIFT